ncbi:MAG TPA: DUF3052 family protein [Candidatus Acidoferrales bacterium]
MPDKDYSHRDITDKLGLKPSFAVRVVGKGDKALLARVREKIGRRLVGDSTPADVILYWPKTVGEITPTLKALREAIVSNGGVWVMTAKKGRRSASGMEYLNQTDLIPLGLAAGLVDNKTCSVSDSESGMRFVIRRKDRNSGK